MSLSVWLYEKNSVEVLQDAGGVSSDAGSFFKICQKFQKSIT